jgi:hypothetical protein
MKTQARRVPLYMLLVLMSFTGKTAGQTLWTNLRDLLVTSDGSRSLGDNSKKFNDTRDQGSKIVYFDPENGDNDTAQVYWWDGKRIVDSSGSATNDDGEAYGTDPLRPNDEAVQPFKDLALKDKPLLRTHKRAHLSEGYPDWFLLRRGRIHDTFDGWLWGGRSEAEPMVVAAYGPLCDGRTVLDLDKGNPFRMHTHGASKAQFHQVIAGLELRHGGLSYLGMEGGCTSPGAPGVPTLLIEDCKIVHGQMNYLPIKSTVRKSISVFNWRVKGHNQGYYTRGFDASPTFEEVIFYKNGYKTGPLTDPDPRRTIFDRNIYQGGGAQMGHTYRNIISADGGSGGPQMRLGGLIENSLIIEGYWYSSTSSNKPKNTWLTADGRKGRSAVVRNNVQLIFKYPSPKDPDTDGSSDNRAQPGWGYSMGGATFGAICEGNIVSGAVLTDDLGFGEHDKGSGYVFGPKRQEYQDGNSYSQQSNTCRGNIAYRVGVGLSLGGDWTGITGNVVKDNVFVAAEPVRVNRRTGTLTSASQLKVHRNRFYTDNDLPDAGWMGKGNSVHAYARAAEAEGWPDPDRTLKRYVTEELHLTLLDWSDDPWLDAHDVAKRVDAGESYDPMGLKTFMAVATSMRKGGTDKIPESGKPSWTGDYPWDARFTGQAVVNWIRAGFNMKKVGGRPAETIKR